MNKLILVGLGLAALAYAGRGTSPVAPSSGVGPTINAPAAAAAAARNAASTFVPNPSSTLSIPAQIHNAVSSARNMAKAQAREANIFLGNRNLLLKRIRAGIGGGSLSFNQVLDLGLKAGYLKGATPIYWDSGKLRGYKVF